MVCKIALGTAIALAVAGVATAAPPPGLPTGSPLGPPMTLPNPGPGKTVIVEIVMTGTLAPGVTSPQMTPIGYAAHGAPATLRVVSAVAKPVIHGQSFRQVSFFAIKNIATKRTVSARKDVEEAQIDWFGKIDEWKSAPTGSEKKNDACRDIASHVTIVLRRVIFGAPGDTALEMWLYAARETKCAPVLNVITIHH